MVCSYQRRGVLKKNLFGQSSSISLQEVPNAPQPFGTPDDNVAELCAACKKSRYRKDPLGACTDG